MNKYTRQIDYLGEYSQKLMNSSKICFLGLNDIILQILENLVLVGFENFLFFIKIDQQIILQGIVFASIVEVENVM